MKYFFHVVSDSNIYQGDVERSSAAVEDAKAHAAVIANELVQDTDWGGCSLLVKDDQRNGINALDDNGSGMNSHRQPTERLSLRLNSRIKSLRLGQIIAAHSVQHLGAPFGPRNAGLIEATPGQCKESRGLGIVYLIIHRNRIKSYGP